MNKSPRFLESGMIQRPHLIGRMARLVTGLFCSLVAFQSLWGFKNMIAEHRIGQLNVSQWGCILIGICVLPDVIDNGYGKLWRPLIIRAAGIAWLALAAAASLLFSGSLPGPPLTVAGEAFLLYGFGHLGISFLLASALSTPGCEMRSMPQLRGMITGQAAQVSYCPGFLTPLDRWEDSLSNHNQD